MNWVKLEDKLPNMGIPCLLLITYPEGTKFNCRAEPLNRSNITIGGMIWGGSFVEYWNQHGKPIEHVTHWMLLPEPPKTVLKLKKKRRQEKVKTKPYNTSITLRHLPLQTLQYSTDLDTDLFGLSNCGEEMEMKFQRYGELSE